jgi:hypothetical protein
MSTENHEKLKNYVTKTEKIPKNDNYVAFIVMSSTVEDRASPLTGVYFVLREELFSVERGAIARTL